MYNDFHSFLVDYDDESVASYDTVLKACLVMSLPLVGLCYFFGWVPLVISLHLISAAAFMNLAKEAHRQGFDDALEKVEGLCPHFNDPYECKACEKNRKSRARYKETKAQDLETTIVGSVAPLSGDKRVLNKDLVWSFTEASDRKKFFEELSKSGTANDEVFFPEASVRVNVLSAFRMDESIYGYDYWEKANLHKGYAPVKEAEPYDDVNITWKVETLALMLDESHRKDYLDQCESEGITEVSMKQSEGATPLNITSNTY